MYFKQIDEIMNGTKTQTRRIVKSNETYLFLSAEGQQHKWTADNGSWHATEQETILEVYHAYKDRLKWQAGRDYAVSPGRGKPGVWWCPRTGEYDDPNAWRVNASGTQKFKPNNWGGGIEGWQPLRIRLLSIEREPLQDISVANAMAEGYPYKWPPDPMVEYVPEMHPDPFVWYRQLWNSINTRPGTRWDDAPDVWALTFEVINDDR